MAAAARPRGRAVAVPSCAGAYVSGAAGSNECPAGSVRIETEAACRAAVTAAGKYVGSLFVYPDSYYPRGCYYITSSNNANFNTHAVGAGDSGRQLLCAAGAPLTPLTPLRAPLRARARIGRVWSDVRVLTGYSKGTRRVLTLYYAPCGVPATLVWAAARVWEAAGVVHAVGVEVAGNMRQRMAPGGKVCKGTHLYSKGTNGGLLAGNSRGFAGYSHNAPSRRRETDCACSAAPTSSPTTAVPTTAAPTRSPTTATPTVSGAHSPVPMR